jgi:hypothetical protein
MSTSNKEGIAIKDWPKVAALINSLPNPPRRQLYYGPPGTGKTTYAQSLVAEFEDITLTPGQFPDVLFGKFLLKDGSTHWAHGTASRAALKGCPLIVNEIHKASSELDSAMNSVLDDSTVARFSLDNGEVIVPKDGYRVIATMNGSPDQLPDTWQDRFDCIIKCNTPHEGLLRRLSPEAAAFIVNQMANAPDHDEWVPTPSPRKFLAWENFRAQGVSDELAADIVFGEAQGKTILMALVDAARNNIRSK